MFDIGFWELVLISIVALLVMGPEKLPVFARDAGRWLGKIKRLINHARHELERELEINERTGLKQKLADLDDLMKNAPDHDSTSMQSKNKNENNEKGPGD